MSDDGIRSPPRTLPSRSDTATRSSDPKLVIRDATGLDDHHASDAVHGAGVAERQSHEPVTDQSEVGYKDLFAQLEKGTSNGLAHVQLLRLEPLGQAVVGLIAAQLFLEAGDRRVLTNEQELDARHLREIGDHLSVHRAS